MESKNKPPQMTAFGWVAYELAAGAWGLTLAAANFDAVQKVVDNAGNTCMASGTAFDAAKCLAGVGLTYIAGRLLMRKLDQLQPPIRPLPTTVPAISPSPAPGNASV